MQMRKRQEITPVFFSLYLVFCYFMPVKVIDSGDEWSIRYKWQKKNIDIRMKICYNYYLRMEVYNGGKERRNNKVSTFCNRSAY